MRKTTTKKVIKLRGDTFSRSGPIAKNVEGGGQIDPPSIFSKKAENGGKFGPTKNISEQNSFLEIF